MNSLEAVGNLLQSLPTHFWQRLAFTLLVLISFYLGLSALLAIPLLQDKSRGALTSDQLIKAIEAAVITKENFDTTYPPHLPTPLDVSGSQVTVQEASNASGSQYFWIEEVKRRNAILDNFENAWGIYEHLDLTNKKKSAIMQRMTLRFELDRRNQKAIRSVLQRVVQLASGGYARYSNKTGHLSQLGRAICRCLRKSVSRTQAYFNCRKGRVIL